MVPVPSIVRLFQNQRPLISCTDRPVGATHPYYCWHFAVVKTQILDLFFGETKRLATDGSSYPFPFNCRAILEPTPPSTFSNIFVAFLFRFDNIISNSKLWQNQVA
jgi:hypothetical protein